jgi:hypothetical protein
VAIPIEAPEGDAALGLGAVARQLFVYKQMGSLRLTVRVEDSSNDPQEHAHQSKSDNQRPSSTKSFDTKENEDRSSYDLVLSARCLRAYG